jgi:oxygen-independent coproporphyrinogen-3 oxidase
MTTSATASAALSHKQRNNLVLDTGLINKYNASGPRYTSYPTADRFHAGITAGQYVNALHNRFQETTDQPKPLSLYVHIPFCNTLCYYCACNKIITKDRSRSARYIDYVGREIALVRKLINGDAAGHIVEQLHLGGGTPTFLSREEMAKLMGMLRGAFTFSPDAEISIEVDPRKVTAEDIVVLGQLGFNRISVGIQDFDPTVQKAVNRIQSRAETMTVIDAARENGFVSVNVDLIYGLPRQTVEGFTSTLEKVIGASPDRIALYSYAHVPHLFKPQRSIDLDTLPNAETKLAILALAIDKLGAAGYLYIGMDHFAKPSDELAVAQAEHKLHRNFQGYSTKPDCDMLAFGVSAIGKVGASYVANVKTLDEYYKHLDAGQLPVMRGVELDADDLIRRDVIQKLMCNFELDFAEASREYAIDFEQYFAPDLAALKPLEVDGLVELDDKSVKVTPRGRLLVRTVAMQFDKYLREASATAKYSKLI